jgi:glycerate kinase
VTVSAEFVLMLTEKGGAAGGVGVGLLWRF